MVGKRPELSFSPSSIWMVLQQRDVVISDKTTGVHVKHESCRIILHVTLHVRACSRAIGSARVTCASHVRPTTPCHAMPCIAHDTWILSLYFQVRTISILYFRGPPTHLLRVQTAQLRPNFNWIKLHLLLNWSCIYNGENMLLHVIRSGLSFSFSEICRNVTSGCFGINRSALCL